MNVYNEIEKLRTAYETEIPLPESAQRELIARQASRIADPATDLDHELENLAALSVALRRVRDKRRGQAEAVAPEPAEQV